MSWMPTASSTGRTAPPAMTPVPGTAGLRNTRPAPKWPVISMGIVVSRSGTKIRSFFACSTALRMASGTSWALPSPTPTSPRPSPTTTSAVNEKRRPPLTTLATRLISTTRSWSSSPDAETVRSRDGISRSRVAGLERQPALTGRLGERLHAPVVLVAAAIEHDLADPGCRGALGQQSTGPPGLIHAAQVAQLGLDPVHRCDGAARVVVDQLHEHTAV